MLATARPPGAGHRHQSRGPCRRRAKPPKKMRVVPVAVPLPARPPTRKKRDPSKSGAAVTTQQTRPGPFRTSGGRHRIPPPCRCRRSTFGWWAKKKKNDDDDIDEQQDGDDDHDDNHDNNHGARRKRRGRRQKDTKTTQRERREISFASIQTKQKTGKRDLLVPVSCKT
uniref:Uncharacterized protein n=1 Tax=Pseudo-nitzschia australis TaxID=44445 RepID=A0A7S4AVE4_9STRA